MSLLARVFRRDRPPAEAVAMLEPGERVTAWAIQADGTAIVATQRGLWHGEGGLLRRLPWHDIHKASWDDGVLSIIPGREVEPGVVVDGPAIRIRLEDVRDLPPEVRTRVTRSVAYSSHHALPRGGVRVVARRVSGVDGLTWVLRFDDGTDRTDPEVREAAAEALDAARALGDVPH